MKRRAASAFVLACATALLAPAGARASGLERFSDFINATRTARGEFEQKIYDKNRRVLQESRGSLAFSRPGRFRWTYAKPTPQLIVGDGAKVWIWDEDLNQVTVKKLDAALGSTPAALLAGNNEAMRAFALAEQGTRGGLEWVEARPRSKEGGFEAIRMGFSAAGLQAMELVDSFGQMTVLKFSALQRNPGLDPSLFRFSPPKGADVIGDVQ